MFILPDFVHHFIGSYGEISLFILLALGIIGLPIPDETLLAFAGYLIAKGHFSVWFAVPACIAGSLAGISVSYVLGRTAGSYLVRRFGCWLGITEKRLA